MIYTQRKEDEEPIFNKIDEVCKQRFFEYFTEEEILEAPPLSVLHNKNFSVYRNKSSFFKLKLIISCLTVRLIMKKYISKSSLKRTHTKYYDLIWGFSKVKLNGILKIESFRVIFKEFFSSQDFEVMLNTDESLYKNKDCFEEKAQKLLQMIGN